MAKQDEQAFLKRGGPAVRQHVAGKPFSDPACSRYFLEFGAVLSLLPPPPADVIDFGCGPGWTSRFLALRGYRVTGVDIAPDMINLARQAADFEGLNFVVGDYETFTAPESYDVVLFYDALHHAEDEKKALQCAWNVLRPGGICVVSEPGKGHARQEESQAAVSRFGVTEKDMPPSRVIRCARQAGFDTFRVYPHPAHLLSFQPLSEQSSRLRVLLEALGRAVWVLLVGRYRHGIVVACKPGKGNVHVA